MDSIKNANDWYGVDRCGCVAHTGNCPTNIINVKSCAPLFDAMAKVT